jgi:hypothetical protein
MTKITYASLKLKTDTSVKSFKYNDSEIEVLQYLPIDEKYSLVNITLQKALEGTIYNPVKKDLYFHLNLVYLYTNITFTDKQREDEAKLYDTLVSNGIMEEVLNNIPDSEYEILYDCMEELESDILNYKNTISGIIREVIDNLPLQAGEMQKIVDSFDKEKFQEVLDFAKAANGGRDI